MSSIYSEACEDLGHRAAKVLQQSATAQPVASGFDVICTDPPYYDAIPYSEPDGLLPRLATAHVARRRAEDANPVFVRSSRAQVGSRVRKPWGVSRSAQSLLAGDKAASKQNYEDGMARAFRACHGALNENGRLVVVFANKSPDAWETLAGALIRAGFVVGGSWPIQTERVNKLAGGARLASSVWLLCRKRPPARPGWDAAVLAEMREKITHRLRDFWDAGIRGPDFVWSATGPALEAFSRHPTVKKADEPGAVMSVSDFLREVRRMVVDFVVGRVLTGDGGTDVTSGLDDVTTYYLLHRGDFGLGDAPAGACILYALSCNLSDRALSDRFDILSRPNRTLFDDLDEEDAAAEEDDDAGASGGGGKVKLMPWNRRKAKWLGYEGPGGRPVPLIDRAHWLMHLWQAGDEAKVNAYLDDHGLGRHALFARLLQALIELSPAGSDERAILESLSNHIAARAGLGRPSPARIGAGDAAMITSLRLIDFKSSPTKRCASVPLLSSLGPMRAARATSETPSVSCMASAGATRSRRSSEGNTEPTGSPSADRRVALHDSALANPERTSPHSRSKLGCAWTPATSSLSPKAPSRRSKRPTESRRVPRP